MRSFATLLLAAGTAASLSVAASAATITLQNGVNGYSGTQDTYLAGYSDWGASTVFDAWSPNRRAIISFDVSSLASLPGTITAVDLRMTQKEASGTQGPLVPFSLFAVADTNAGWKQGPGTGQTEQWGKANWYGEASDWVNGPPYVSTQWHGGNGLGDGTSANNGPGYNPTAVATGTYDYNQVGQTIDLSLPVTLIQHWITGPNAGLLLDNTTEYDAQFWSSEAPTIGDRPSLVITYTPVPEPVTGSLLLIGGGLLALRRTRS